VLKEDAIRTTTLSNGLIVLTERMEHVRSVAMGIWTKSGARQDAPDLTGLSHFVEHLVFKGTRTRSAEQISRDADAIGGNLNAYTTHEMVAFTNTVLDNHVPEAIGLLSDLVSNPTFASDAIDLECGAIIEEINGPVDNPEFQVAQAFNRKLWGNHSLSLPIPGTPGTISRFTSDTLFQYKAERFTGQNLILVAAGNFQHDDLVSQAERFLGSLPVGKPIPSGPPPTFSPGLTLLKKRAKQAQILLGFPTPQLRGPRLYTAHVMNLILGDGAASRLFQSVRERRGLAYDVSSDYLSYRDAGRLRIFAGTSASNVVTVINLILDEIRRLKDELVPEDDLQRVKDKLSCNQVLAQETSSERAASLAAQYLGFGRPLSVDELREAIEGVTAEHIREFANFLFRGDTLVCAIRGAISGLHLSPGHLAL
jgi:predicted Zn-dependent peptidase